MAETEPRLVMLIDDEPAQSRLVAAVAARAGWRVIVVSDADRAIDTLDTRQGMLLSAIIVDQWLPGDHTCALIAELSSRRPALPILMLTASASPLLAVEAMRAGATDYLIKPVAPDRLMQALRSATEPTLGGPALGRPSGNWTPRAELQPLSEKMTATPDFESMIGASPGFRAGLAIAAKGARGNAPVLIEGECGSGKEMLARAIHAASMRSRSPLRIVKLGTTPPPGSIESTLFGHEKGAFPGAFDRQIGAIQLCDGGTLLLDEVDCLPKSIQHRLLEAIKRSDCRPVGARHGFRVDVRYIFAADFALGDMVREGHFLPELCHAMSAVSLTLPPLRERNGDMAALARHFLTRIGEQPGLRPLGITDGAMALLAAYDWPGNVRQLQAVLFRAAVFCDGDALTPDDFPQLVELASRGAAASAHRQENASITLFATDGNLRPLDDIEADVIRLAIGHYRGRMTEVARRLGIGRSTLYRRLAELGINSPVRDFHGITGSQTALTLAPPVATGIVAA